MSEKQLITKLVRLAHQKPELAEDILSLFQREAATQSAELAPAYYVVFSRKNKVLYYFGKAKTKKGAHATASRLANKLKDLRNAIQYANQDGREMSPDEIADAIKPYKPARPMFEMALTRKYPLQDVVAASFDAAYVTRADDILSMDTYFLDRRQRAFLKEVKAEMR